MGCSKSGQYPSTPNYVSLTTYFSSKHSVCEPCMHNAVGVGDGTRGQVVMMALAFSYKFSRRELTLYNTIGRAYAYGESWWP